MDSNKMGSSDESLDCFQTPRNQGTKSRANSATRAKNETNAAKQKQLNLDKEQREAANKQAASEINNKFLQKQLKEMGDKFAKIELQQQQQIQQIQQDMQALTQQQMQQQQQQHQLQVEKLQLQLQQQQQQFQQQLQQQQQQQQPQQQPQQQQQQQQQHREEQIPTRNSFNGLPLEDEDANGTIMEVIDIDDDINTDNNTTNNNEPFIVVKKNLKRTNNMANKNNIKQQAKQQRTNQNQPSTSMSTGNNNNNNNNNNVKTINNTNTNTTITNNNNNNNINNNNNNNKRALKPPPIHIHQQKINDTIQLTKGAEINQFNIKRINKNKHTLQLENMEDYYTAKKNLIDVEAPFFTYTPKDEKNKIIVLKGLHEEENLDDLKKQIEEHSVEVVKITQLKTKHSKQMETKLPLYIVHCAPTTNMGNIYKIKSLNYQRVQWESLRKQDGIMQCHTCQRFGHAATNCNLHYRCVKCSEQHNPGECKLKEKQANADIYCANCKLLGHPASYKGCPVYIATLARLKNRIKDKRIHARQPAEIPITKNTYVNKTSGTFAELLQGGRQHLQQQQQQQQHQNYQHLPQTHLPQQQQQQQQQQLYSQQQTLQQQQQYQQQQKIDYNSIIFNSPIIIDINQKIDKLAETVNQQAEQLSTLVALLHQLAGPLESTTSSHHLQ